MVVVLHILSIASDYLGDANSDLETNLQPVLRCIAVCLLDSSRIVDARKFEFDANSGSAKATPVPRRNLLRSSAFKLSAMFGNLFS